MAIPGLRNWEYVGGIQLWDKRMVDIYESPLNDIRLFDGFNEVKCTDSDLKWLIDNIQCNIVGWRERRITTAWC